MNTPELITTAAAIAGPIAAQAFNDGHMDANRKQEIARTAVQIVMEIEKEARKAVTGH